MLTGISILAIHEISQKNQTTTILLLFGIFIVILEATIRPSPLFNACLVCDISLLYAHPIQILDTIQRIALISFIVIALIYIFARNSFDEESNTKDIVKDIIIICFFIWISSFSIMIIFSIV
jgi:hypothetical protein